MCDDEDLRRLQPWRGISPLASREDREQHELDREAHLRWVIKGPALFEESQRAQEELHEMRYGSMTEEEEWTYGG